MVKGLYYCLRLLPQVCRSFIFLGFPATMFYSLFLNEQYQCSFWEICGKWVSDCLFFSEVPCIVMVFCTKDLLVPPVKTAFYNYILSLKQVSILRFIFVSTLVFRNKPYDSLICCPSLFYVTSKGLLWKSCVGKRKTIIMIHISL